MSALALAMRREFSLVVRHDGHMIHEDVPVSAKFAPMQLRRSLIAPEILRTLRARHAALRRDTLPDELGRGLHHAAIEWHGQRPLTLRWTQRGATREFGGDPRVTGPVIDFVDGLRSLLAWLDAGGPDPPWPAASEPRNFPRREDLLRGTPAARLTSTHDWNGAQRHARLHEVWVAATGEGELRVLRTDTDPPVEVHTARGTLEPTAARSLFAALAALDPQRFRPAVGFVRTTCDLDRTEHHTFSYFDGARVVHTSLVSGSERGIGVVHGDTPPTSAESEAFQLLRGLKLG
jgi:hypothetical protein